MHKRNSIFLCILCLITFGITLLNGFVGDDNVVIVRNDFYSSFQNLNYLFKKEYFTDSDVVFNEQGRYFHSGSVAYRPVLSLSFFLDYAIWKQNPLGYHLTNVIIHLLNVLLVYHLLIYITRHQSLSFLSAIIFCIHPLKVEPVAAIGYRADILSSLFLLLSLLCHIGETNIFDARIRARKILKHLFFLLAIFTKEAAVIYIFILYAYGWCYQGQKGFQGFIRTMRAEWGVLAITFFYLYVYIFVFPNKALPELTLYGGNLLSHIAISLKIFEMYLTSIFLANTVGILPPVYRPDLLFNPFWDSAFSFLIIFLILIAVLKLVPDPRQLRFFVFFSFVALIPVSNIVPLVSPVAYRYLYLPSVGFSVVLAVLLIQWADFCDRYKSTLPLGRILKASCIFFCIWTSIILSFVWKNEFLIAQAMVRDFPNSPVGYMYLGLEQFRRGEVGLARKNLEFSFNLGFEDPRLYHFLGVCYINDSERSKIYFERCVKTFPPYAPAYTGLGRYYLFHKDISRAMVHLKTSISLAPTYTGYGYLIQAYLMDGQVEQAEAYLDEAKKHVYDQAYVASLERFLKMDDFQKLPVDIGI